MIRFAACLTVSLLSLSAVWAECLSPPSGLAHWWAGDGDATDSAGSHDGTESQTGFAPGFINQAFSLDDRVYGFQFHLEADVRTIRTFLTVSKYRKLAGKGIQNEAEIMAGIDRHLPDQQKHLNFFLAHLLPSPDADTTRDPNHL